MIQIYVYMLLYIMIKIAYMSIYKWYRGINNIYISKVYSNKYKEIYI